MIQFSLRLATAPPLRVILNLEIMFVSCYVTITLLNFLFKDTPRGVQEYQPLLNRMDIDMTFNYFPGDNLILF